MNVRSVWAMPVVITALISARPAAAVEFLEPLPAETPLQVAKLPARYPPTWVFLNYASDRIELRDVGSDARLVKGELQARDSSTLLVPRNRPEIYVADTVWSRYTRGTRTDYITIYDTQTLNPIGEIVLPDGKRALITPMQGLFAFTDHERMALVFDFTPASSVTVVDLLNRKVLGSIDIPGCSLVYPSGERGFSTLCASGTVLSVSLDAHGKVTGRSESRRFNDLDANPLFTASAAIGGIRYFPTLRGDLQPIDMRGAVAKILPSWSLVSPAERAQHWRPSGWQLIAGDGDKRLYVLMQPNGHEGTHKDPGTEVWVFDAGTDTRVDRMRLVRPGSSIGLTHGATPLLLVQTNDRLDVYDPKTLRLIRSLGIPGFHSRMLIQPVD